MTCKTFFFPLFQLEKFKSEAERLRKRVQVLEEEGQTTIQPVLETHIEAEREMDFMEEPEKLPKILEQDKTPKDQKVISLPKHLY